MRTTVQHNGDNMASYDENFADYKSLIGKLVSGEKKVVSLEADQREAIFEAALKQTLANAENVAGRILGNDRIWITRSLSIVIAISDIEDHPSIKKYINKDGYLESAEFHPEITERIEIIRATLSFFVEENDCPGRTVAMMALAATNHPLDFYEEGPIDGDLLRWDYYVRIPFKHGYIRVKKDQY